MSSKELFKKYLQERIKLDKQISHNDDMIQKANETINKMVTNKKKDLEAKKEKYKTDPEFRKKRIEASTKKYYKEKEEKQQQQEEQLNSVEQEQQPQEPKVYQSFYRNNFI